MDFLLNKIVEWIKGILIGGIMDNLNGLFDGINGQVADIAGTVGATPQSWNSSVFNMIKGLSDNVIIPVAGVVLTAVMCYELIQMVIDRNSLHDFETFVFFKWVVKAAVSVLIISHTWDIIMGIFDVAQRVVNGAAGNIISNADLDLSSVVSGMEAGLRSMELGSLFTLWSQTAIISLISWAMTICIFVVIYGRMIEIYLVTSIAPIPLATMANREWGQMGQHAAGPGLPGVPHHRVRGHLRRAGSHHCGGHRRDRRHLDLYRLFRAAVLRAVQNQQLIPRNL